MKKFYGLYSEGSKINQIQCAILINIPMFTLGASIGWLSPMALLLQSDESPRNVSLSDYEVSWMASVPYLICVPGTFLMACLGDVIGRRKALILISATSAASWVLLLSPFELWSLILSRALVGVVMAGSYVTCPIYTKEISEESIRGALACLVILFHTTGNLFLYVIGDIFRYRTILWICLSVPTFHLVLFMVMPDSPAYLLKSGQNAEAVRVLSWLRCREEDDTSIKEEVDLITAEQKNGEKENVFLLKTIWQDKVLFKAFYIALIATLAREICGTVPILNFAGEIFKIASTNSSLVLTPNQEAMLLGVVQVAGVIFASIIVKKSGRKLLFLGTALVSGLSMCTLASWFVAKDYEVSMPNWLPAATLCISIFCDAFGIQPVSVVLIGEIFSYKYRGVVVATTVALSSFADFIQLIFSNK